MQKQDLLLYIYFFAGFSIYLGYIFYSTYRRHEKLKALLRSIGSGLGLDNASVNSGIYVSLFKLTGTYEGKGLEIEIKPVEGYLSHEINVRLQVASAFSLCIYPEDLNEKFEKLVGIISEVDIGIPSFDCRYVIQTDSPSQAVMFLSSVENRDMIDSMIKGGIKYINMSPGRIIAKVSVFDPESNLIPDRLKSILADLLTLSSKLS